MLKFKHYIILFLLINSSNAQNEKIIDATFGKEDGTRHLIITIEKEIIDKKVVVLDTIKLFNCVVNDKIHLQNRPLFKGLNVYTLNKQLLNVFKSKYSLDDFNYEFASLATKMKKKEHKIRNVLSDKNKKIQIDEFLSEAESEKDNNLNFDSLFTSKVFIDDSNVLTVYHQPGGEIKNEKIDDTTSVYISDYNIFLSSSSNYRCLYTKGVMENSDCDKRFYPDFKLSKEKSFLYTIRGMSMESTRLYVIDLISKKIIRVHLSEITTELPLEGSKKYEVSPGLISIYSNSKLIDQVRFK